MEQIPGLSRERGREGGIDGGKSRLTAQTDETNERPMFGPVQRRSAARSAAQIQAPFPEIGLEDFKGGQLK